MSTVRTRRETITGSFFNPDAGRNSPGGSADLPQRNVLPPRCLTLRLFFFFFFLEPLYPFQRCSIRSHPFLLLPLLSLFLSVVVPSRPFVSRPLALPSPPPLPPHSTLVHPTPFLTVLTLKLAFSLLSSEAADFPHFTFQSHGGRDFLPHFHSDNIEGAPTSRRSKEGWA